MSNYQLSEVISRNTLLGIRFWDPALDEQIRYGLNVVLFSINNKLKKIRANCTRSGIYAFNDIPGMIDLETPLKNVDTIFMSPVETKQYVLEVHDPKERFISVALLIELPLPYKGLFLVDDNSASPGNPPRGFNLYSSINRSSASQFTFVRGELVDRNSGLPATNAIVRIETEDEFRWYGISDKDGKFSVMMPYPFINMSFGSSPPSSDGVRLFQRTWTVSITVLYEPLAQVPLVGSELPDYSSVLNQEQASMYTELPETDVGEVMEMQIELAYGRDLIVKTEGFSELYVSQTGSPV